MKSTLAVLILAVSFNAAFAQLQSDSLFVHIIGDTVNIWDVRAEENCASRFRFALNVSQDTVTWVQTDTIGPIVTCLCFYNLRASLTGFFPGSYRAMVYRERLTQYHYERDTIIFIGSVLFSVVSPGGSVSSDFYQSGCNPVSVSENGNAAVPAAFTLANYPNPFNPVTTISYTLPTTSHVRLEVFNMIGQLVAVLTDEERSAGTHSVEWRADVASGIYHCRLKATSLIGSTSVVQALKLVVLR